MYVASFLSEFIIHTGKTFFRSGNDPFFKDFKKNILSNKNYKTKWSFIKDYYDGLVANKELLVSESPGAGSRSSKRNTTLSDYARRTSVNEACGNLLFNLASNFQPGQIFELGTAFGISTMLMAEASPLSVITTVEGNRQIAEIAESGFRKYGYNNIKVLNRMFDDVVPELSAKITANTMVFIDGNHRYNATLNYYQAFSEASVIILDDIRWSEEMIRAWKSIRKEATKQTATILDFFDIGIILKSGQGKDFTFWL